MLIALTNELRSMVRHCAFTTHKHNHYCLNIVGDSQSYIIHQQETHTEAAPAAAKEQSRKASKTHNGINTGGAESCLCVTHRIFDGPFGSLERHAPPILLFWSLLLASIWKQTRQGAHYIHVPLSPACHKLPFPSPVGRQLIRQQWASQPASQQCELWAPGPLSLSLSLPFSLCCYPPAFPLSLSLYRTVLSLICLPSLSRSLLLLARRAAQWQGVKILPNSPRCLSQQTETRLTSIRAPPIWLRAQEEEKEVDSDGKRGVLRLEKEGKKRKKGAELECGWRGREGSMLHVGWVMEGCSMEQWQLKRKKCSVWGVGVKNDIYSIYTLPGRTWQVCKGSRRQSKFKVDGRG